MEKNSTNSHLDDVDLDDINDHANDNDMNPLLGNNKKGRRRGMHLPSLTAQYNSETPHFREARSRAFLLAFSLFLNLGIFWLLDSLKDPLFAMLLGDDNTNNSNFESNQPRAKMVSVASTMVLVYLLELFMKQNESSTKNNGNEVEAQWKAMHMATSTQKSTSGENEEQDAPAMSMISHIHIPYSILFFVLALVIRRYPAFQSSLNNDPHVIPNGQNTLVAYILYVAIESFGSLSVAAFWSYSNSTLDIDSAKKNYGFIIAAAQIGAIAGSTLASLSLITIPHMLLLSSALMVCNMLLMIQYHIWYPRPLNSSNMYDGEDMYEPSNTTEKTLQRLSLDQDKEAYTTSAQHSSQSNNEFHIIPVRKEKSGLLLIFQHNYLLSILAVSCLYEISLTCLDYEMKLVGLSRFNLSDENSTFSFKTFMGRYGQLTNLLSLLLSFYGFPILMDQYSVKFTLRIFPGFLVLITIFTFTILPSNLWLLFLSMALLKAMTYSINDPAKEILYMPTSSTIKVKAKFWIDVVGARFAKALGSSITNYAGSAERIVKVGGVPSVLSSLVFLYFCIQVGDEFEDLVRRNKIVGEDEDDYEVYDDDDKYNQLNQNDYDDDETFSNSLIDDDETRDDNDYLVSMDPFTYKAGGGLELDPEGCFDGSSVNSVSLISVKKTKSQEYADL